jgi:hypothetical protein
MLLTVLDYLKSDDELTDILNHTLQHPKITAYKAVDKTAYPYIVVTLTPFDIGTVTGQYRAEVRIVTDNHLLVEPLTTKVIDLLHFGNKPAIQIHDKTLFHSTFAGNGFLFDEKENVFEQPLFFSMTFGR